MSEMIIIECDYKDGECLSRMEGFEPFATDVFKQKYLRDEGWLVQDDKHYCPKHKEYVESEFEKETEQE